jgi:hypothetical protein
MVARPTLKRGEDQTERRLPPTQAKPTEERFILKVDGQAKRSFAQKDVAFRFGAEIKRKFPVVVVSVTDSEEGTSELVPSAAAD